MNGKACLCAYSLLSYPSEGLPAVWVAAVYIGKMPQDKEVDRTGSPHNTAPIAGNQELLSEKDKYLRSQQCGEYWTIAVPQCSGTRYPMDGSSKTQAVAAEQALGWLTGCLTSQPVFSQH